MCNKEAFLLVLTLTTIRQIFKTKKKETGCCSLDSINDARNIAVSLGFPHYILDIREEFGDYVIDHFTNEYLSGRTPNPCVLCNTHIKWDALLKRADKLDCEFMVTGHYAKIRNWNGRYVISKGDDELKDQSYALWGVSQQSLSRTMLPLGNLRKSQIREKALEMGFHDLVNKSESYEICFVPDNDYRGFLKRRVHGLEDKVIGGEFVLENGSVVGTHDGYPFYTIGQRKGLGDAFGKPMYVTEIIASQNKVVLGELDDLSRNGMWVRKLNFQKYPSINGGGLQAVTKIRYNNPGTESNIYSEGDKVRVEFDAYVNAIAPGQSAVFYEGDDVIGGGLIESGFNLATNGK
ncbi:MAG: tRNA 2-thiouridine(34) synthase MnmA [Bacteroidetes bacterium]|nr:tRNA 2-thiouridine(34) synthase MnmA [Bacteroidota bacterium]